MRLFLPVRRQPASPCHLQGLRIMPKADPNKIDVEEAIRLYTEKPDWHFVASQMKRPNGTPYTTNAICAAVRRHDRGVA